jgi:3-methyladenine DNA glycosylase AlkD
MISTTAFLHSVPLTGLVWLSLLCRGINSMLQGDTVMNTVEKIKCDLARHSTPGKDGVLYRYFQAFPGGYGEGDRFLGVKVPEMRKIARRYYKVIALNEIEQLLQDPYHECRLTALIMLCICFEKASTEEQKEDLVSLYLRNLAYVNNWDLVDTSADKILGAYLFHRDKSLLFKLAGSGDLWKQRVAIMATFYFIKQGRFTETLELAQKMMNHEHDLIHKAVGWMLREIGKRDFRRAYNFLRSQYRNMPRTMLRYAIEKYDTELRQQFLKGQL